MMLYQHTRLRFSQGYWHGVANQRLQHPRQSQAPGSHPDPAYRAGYCAGYDTEIAATTDAAFLAWETYRTHGAAPGSDTEPLAWGA